MNTSSDTWVLFSLGKRRVWEDLRAALKNTKGAYKRAVEGLSIMGNNGKVEWL